MSRRTGKAANSAADQQDPEMTAILELTDRYFKALGFFDDPALPPWERTVEGVKVFGGMPMTHLPPKLEHKVHRTFASINPILANYTISTWDDYQAIADQDLMNIQRIVRELIP